MDFIIGAITNQTFWTAVGALGAIAALIFLASQTIAMRKSIEQNDNNLKFDSEWRKKNKASELAFLYANDIIPRMSYVTSVLGNTSYYQMLNSLDARKMIRFTQGELREMNENLADVKITDIVSGLDVGTFISLRIHLAAEYKVDLIDEGIALFSKKEELENLKPLLVEEFSSVVTCLLNDLEYFSMCINCGIASDDIIFPSLHQTFINTISILYFAIAQSNSNRIKDRFFTHIIKLYGDWQARCEELAQKERRLESELCEPYSKI